MSTRSSIAIKENNQIKSIYCHFDGYTSHNGKILYENYTDENMVNELINLGDISVLAESVNKSVAYSRDRGEKHHMSFHIDEKDWYKHEHSYNYLWKDGKWYLNGNELVPEMWE